MRRDCGECGGWAFYWCSTCRAFVCESCVERCAHREHDWGDLDDEEAP